MSGSPHCITVLDGIRSSGALTNVLTPTTTIGLADSYDALALEINYMKGAGDSMQLVIDTASANSITEDTDWFRRVTESTSSGVTTVAQQEFKFDTTGRYSLLIQPVRAKQIMIKVRNGGDVNGTNCIINGYLTNTYRG